MWAVVLVIQAAAFTWVSRARNSGSVIYHSVAAVFSNGVWFVSQLFLIGFVARPSMPFSEILLLGTIYTASTTFGATLMHIASMRWLETGKRKVGG
jgi:hypothetical protein